MKEQLWPSEDYVDFQGGQQRGVRFYDKQIEIIYSVERNIETVAVAGNKLGKDYVTGFICPCLFLRCILTNQTCRIVTTSVAAHHLDVLWGEIGRFIATSKQPLLAKDGGPLVVNSMEIRRATEMVHKNPLNYLVGKVSAKGEGLAGHHADVTLAVGDEASGLDPIVWSMVQGWAKRELWIGNPNPCPAGHPFFEHVKGGDVLATNGV